MKEFYIPAIYVAYIAMQHILLTLTRFHKYHESNLFRREQRKYKYFKIIC